MHLQFVVSAIILGFIPKVISYDSSYCFPANGVELRAAVKEYFYGGKNDGSIGTWCVDNVRDFRNLFKNVNTEDFQTVDLGSWNLESATNIANMFLGAKKYQGVGIGKWNVSNVKAMNNAFRDCLNFNEDLGEWDVSSVLSMRGMFRNADKFDGTSIVGWNVQKVKNFDEMFRYSNAVNADLSGWNIASAKTMKNMFRSTQRFNQNLCAWGDTLSRNGASVANMFTSATACELKGSPLFSDGAVQSMCADCTLISPTMAPEPSPTFMPSASPSEAPYCFPANGVELRAAVKEYFYGGKNDGSIGTWCVDNVRDFRNLFKNVNTADFQTVDLGSWNLESATNIANMFLGAKKYQGVGIGKWNVSNVKAMNNAFRDCLNFNEDLGEWDVSSVLSMRGMFRNADKFDGTSIVGWNVQKVKNFDEMFRYSNAVNADLSGWNIASAKTMKNMFRSTQRFNQNLCAWGDTLSRNGASVANMFTSATACELKGSPLFSDGAVQSMCMDCTNASPTSSPTQPTALPTPIATSEATSIPTAPPTVGLTIVPTHISTSRATSAPSTIPTVTSTSHLTSTPTSDATTSILPNWNFEEPILAPWGVNGLNEVQLATEGGISGQYALISGRRTTCCTWEGIAQYIEDYVVAGVIYSVSFWAKLANVNESTVSRISLTMAEKTGDTTKYTSVATSGTGMLTTTWTKFSGSYQLDPDRTVDSLRLYFESVENGLDFAVDEVAMQNAKPATVEYFVDATSNTEHVVIPKPDQPDLTIPRAGCPHDDSDLTDWNDLFGTISPGENVTIPVGQSVLISSSVEEILGLVTVPATSSLIIGESAVGLKLDVEGFDIEGALIAGSETCRYETPLTITLHGTRPAGITDQDNAMPRWYKGISVTGRLELHGKRYFRTWTRLARRAYPGDNYLYLQDEVNWEAGQEIVLITSAVHDTRDWHQNEIFTIISVETNTNDHNEVKSIVFLSEPIKYEHIARREYQAEVGLLTRTIKIQGSDDSIPTDVSASTCATHKTSGTSTTLFGYDQIVCPDTYLTGYGGHMMVHSGGVGYVEGVELYRMGQTNVMARYPMHFHMLGNGCPGCYLRDSSIHESYFRCISIHGTNGIEVSENVAFDITGFCYYLEDGVEEHNTLSYNLAAHVHVIGSPAIGAGQQVPTVTESLDLALPADIAASGFYITNMHNRIIGNVAVGGWAGFAFPVLHSPTGPYRTLDFTPSERVALEIDGNTAHSTAFFWGHAAAFYFGGSLYYNEDGKLEYNAGRDLSHSRSPCSDDAESGKCNGSFNVITNTKVFLAGHVGIGSWSGKMEVIDYECHDLGLALEALAAGFWIDKMHVTCRTGEVLSLPAQNAHYIQGDGIYWYDTGQEHILTDSLFRNCGYRSDSYDQYDTSPSRGCDSNPYNGCSSDSTVFGFLTHSDQHNPEVMQATRNITFDDVGRRFRFSVTSFETVSGRIQNWYDVDGTATGLDEPVYMGSGYDGAGLWWNVDDDVVKDEQAPLYFIKKNDGPARGLAHVRFEWDADLHNLAGSSNCTNGATYVGDERIKCNPVGRIRHLGSKYDQSADPVGGLPVTAQPDVVGLGGGFGWLLELDGGAPHTLQLSKVEMTPGTAVFLSIAYPTGTSFTVSAKAASWCSSSCYNSCEEHFFAVHSLEDVRSSEGNTYYFDSATGILTLRVTMIPETFTGQPDWKLYTFDDISNDGSTYALKRFERDGVLLPQAAYYSYIEISADCSQSGAYCAESPPSSSDFNNVCSSGYIQTSYDRCCSATNPDECEYAFIAPATTAPGETPAPTPTPSNILENGDFELSSGICPWGSLGSGVTSRESTDVYEGTGAALASSRSNTYDGIYQYVTDRFQYNTTYTFKAQAKILDGDSSNTMKVTFRVRYENDISPKDYFSVLHRSNLPTDTWEALETQFTLSSTSLDDYPVEDLMIYFETPGHTHSFLVDNVSMEAVENNIFNVY